MKAEQIAEELGLDYSKILNIYPYGSTVYGTNDEESDSDYIIVFNSATLDSGAFKDNAISNEDRTIQGVCYSRGGFIDAINNYEIGALECISLPEEDILQKKWPFKMQKYDEKEMVKKIITKASASWHIASQNEKFGYEEGIKKGCYHALRILMFGLQIKEHKKIVDFTVGNELRKQIMNDEDFKMKKYIALRDELMEKLRV